MQWHSPVKAVYCNSQQLTWVKFCCECALTQNILEANLSVTDRHWRGDSEHASGGIPECYSQFVTNFLGHKNTIIVWRMKAKINKHLVYCGCVGVMHHEKSYRFSMILNMLCMVLPSLQHDWLSPCQNYLPHIHNLIFSGIYRCVGTVLSARWFLSDLQV